MPGPLSETTDERVPDDPEFLYAVLNLPTTASEQEIRDRYRQLSVIFHPDKQHDQLKTDTATKRFLEVQKAYEVLSDPLTRRAYDLLGSDGLKTLSHMQRGMLVDDHMTVSPEFEKLLLESHAEEKRVELDDLIRPRGIISATLDVSRVLAVYNKTAGNPLDVRLLNTLFSIRRTGLKLRHSVETKISDKTSVALSGTHEAQGKFGRDKLVVAVTHKYSPHLSLKTSASTSYIERIGINVEGAYSDKDQTALVRTSVTKAFIGLLSLGMFNVWIPPPTTVAYSRRLSRDSPLVGSLEVVTLSTNKFPVLRLGLGSSSPFGHVVESTLPKRDRDFEDDEDVDDVITAAPSKSGLSRGSRYWNLGMMLALGGAGPSLNAEFGVRLVEIGITLRTIMQYSVLGGIGWIFGADWSKGGHSVGASVELGFQDVTLKFDFASFGQQFSLPITLSNEHDHTLALWTTVLPSTGLLLAYHFVLKPQRRRERIEFFRKARQQLRDEKADIIRDVKETTALLQETAKKHMRIETACDGLIILEASYGPSERDETTEGLDVDVTVPMQALVNQSQVYIPGRTSKAGLQGFYDPVPAVAKTLRVRYTFRGRMHYAEFPDYVPVVLPLQEHLVD